MAKVFQTDVILKLVDHLAGPLVRTARSVERSTGMIRRSFASLDRAGGRLAAGFMGAAGLTRAVEGLGRQMVEISKLQNKINAAAVSIEEGSGKPMAQFLSDMEKSANLQSAIDNSKKYSVAVQQFLKSQDELIRAGNNPAAARAASAYATILGKFAGMDSGKVAEQLTSLMVDYKLPRGNAEQIEATIKSIGNLLAFAETSAPGKIADLFESFRFAGSMLATTGTDLKQSTAILIALAKANVKGSEAGVALRSMLVSLVRPTKKGREALDKMGLSYDDFVQKTVTTGKSLGDALSKYSQGESLDALFPGFNPAAHEKALDAIAGMKDIVERQKALTDFIKQQIPAAANMGADELATIVNENLATAGTKVDLTKFFKTALEKGIPAEALVRIFEGRQFNRINLAIQHAMDIAATAAKGIQDDLLEKMFGETQKGLGGAVDTLESTMTRFAAILERSQVGKDLEKIIRGLAGAIEALSDAFNKFDPDTQRWVAIATAITVLVGLTAPILGLAAAFTRLAGGMAAAATAGAAVGAAAGAAGGAGAAAATTAGAAAGTATGAAAGGGLGALVSIFARVAGPLALIAGAAPGIAAIGEANRKLYEGVDPGQQHNEGQRRRRAYHEQLRQQTQSVRDGMGNEKSAETADWSKKASMGFDLLKRMQEGAAQKTGATSDAMDRQSSSADALAAKAGTVAEFSQTVQSAMQTITQSVSGAVDSFSKLIGQINGAAAAAKGLGATPMGVSPGAAAAGKTSAMGTPGGASPHSPGPGSGRSSTGAPTRVAVDISSSDGSVKVNSASTSGSGDVSVASRGRRMA